MSASDQAFIKAFAKGNPEPTAGQRQVLAAIDDSAGLPLEGQASHRVDNAHVAPAAPSRQFNQAAEERSATRRPQPPAPHFAIPAPQPPVESDVQPPAPTVAQPSEPAASEPETAVEQQPVMNPVPLSVVRATPTQQPVTATPTDPLLVAQPPAIQLAPAPVEQPSLEQPPLTQPESAVPQEPPQAAKAPASATQFQVAEVIACDPAMSAVELGGLLDLSDLPSMALQVSVVDTLDQLTLPQRPDIIEMATEAQPKPVATNTVDDPQPTTETPTDQRSVATTEDQRSFATTEDQRSFATADPELAAPLHEEPVAAKELPASPAVMEADPVEEKSSPAPAPVLAEKPEPVHEVDDTPPPEPASAAPQPVATPPQPETQESDNSHEEEVGQLQDKLSVDGQFSPAWEVDQFQWPAICSKLMQRRRDYFAKTGEGLANAVSGKAHVLAITSAHRHEGRTTLALCLAKCAAEAGARVALIDCDLLNPELADCLGLEVTHGWPDAVSGDAPLGDTAILSLEDNITLFPIHPETSLDRELRLSTVLEVVEGQFDLILLDLPPTSDRTGQPEVAPQIQTAIVVRDIRSGDETDSAQSVRQLKRAGVEAIGVAENFSRAA